MLEIPDRVRDNAADGRMDLKVEREVGDDSEWPQGNPAPGGVAPEALGAAAGRGMRPENLEDRLMGSRPEMGLRKKSLAGHGLQAPTVSRLKCSFFLGGTLPPQPMERVDAEPRKTGNLHKDPLGWMGRPGRRVL